MTRRPASRRPPKLPDVPDAREQRVDQPRKKTLREQVIGTRVTGTHARLGRAEFLSMMRRLRDGERSMLWGLDPFPALELDEILEVARTQWGWRESEQKVASSPDHSRAALARSLDLIDEVARRGGRIAFATGRPASMLGLYRSLAARARAGGADLIDERQTGEFRSDGRSGRRLWWLDGVAAVTDGEHLLAQSGIDAADEFLFWVPRPQLVVADVGFAAGAARDGIETVAFADLDAVALGVAAARGRRVTVVPVDVSRPPYAYRLLLEWAEDLLAEHQQQLAVSAAADAEADADADGDRAEDGATDAPSGSPASTGEAAAIDAASA